MILSIKTGVFCISSHYITEAHRGARLFLHGDAGLLQWRQNKKGRGKISRPKAAGRNDEPLAVFQGNEQIIGLLAVQPTGLALNGCDLVHRLGKLRSHISVDGVLLGVLAQTGHDKELLGVQSLLDIFTDPVSRELDGQHELTGAAGEQGGTCNSSSGQTGDLHKVTAGKIHNETLLVIA